MFQEFVRRQDVAAVLQTLSCLHHKTPAARRSDGALATCYHSPPNPKYLNDCLTGFEAVPEY
eukprot:1919688-Rhodomonas_salina.1